MRNYYNLPQKHLKNFSLIRFSFFLMFFCCSLASTKAIAVGEFSDTNCNGMAALSNKECWYIGGGVGISHIKPNPIAVPGYQLHISDDSDTSLKAYAGLTFGKHLFAEMTYESLGSPKLNYGPSDLSTSTTTNLINYKPVSISAGYWLKGRDETWDIFAKAGYSRMKTNDSPVEISDDMLSLGLGAEWRFAPYWFARAEYTYYNQDANSIGLNVARFLSGNQNKKAVAIQPKVVATQPVAPVKTSVSKPTSESVDNDDDGVLNTQDQCPDSPKDANVDTRGCPLLETITLNIQFDSNKSILKKEYLAEIVRTSNVIKKFGDIHITVEGHTDSQGNAPDNQTLSESRARVVSERLMQLIDAPEEDITVIGYGEEKPIADNTTSEGRYKNRRVTVVISEK